MEQPTLFEYFWDHEQLKWIPWAQKIPKYIHDPARKFNEILVPTVDTVRTDWLLQGQVGIKRPVLLVGETGTSKTATTANFLRDMDKESNVSSGKMWYLFYFLDRKLLIFDTVSAIRIHYVSSVSFSNLIIGGF